MKRISKVFLGLGALTLLGSGALAIGLAHSAKEPVRANADAAGTTWIDLTGCTGWENDGAKFAVYYWAGGNNGWSGWSTPDSEHEHIFTVQYNLLFCGG